MGNGVTKQRNLHKQRNRHEAIVFGERKDNFIANRPDVDLVVADAFCPEWERPDVFIFSKPSEWTATGGVSIGTFALLQQFQS